MAIKLVSDCGTKVSEPDGFTPDPELIAQAEILLERCKDGSASGFVALLDSNNGRMGCIAAGMFEHYALSAFAARRFAVMIEEMEQDRLE